ncbi:MAG: sugar phosphate isomerase/epimerase family protein [Rhodothermales bacterium]|nr:sugar phosphate isomerase/epimerase family protein [Rhodothermales bacterium]
MDRRTFLQNSALVAIAAPLWSSCAPGGTDTAETAVPAVTPVSTDALLARIGITTVCIRSYFAKTRAFAAEPNTAPTITLEQAPQFIYDRFGLRNVEVWDFQFDEMTLAYCEKIRNAAERIGSRITNIQVDEGMADLSDVDPAQRALGVKQSKEWVDRCVAMGVPSFRVNTGGKAGQEFLVDVTADSFRQIAEYAGEKNVTVLVENHVGFSMNIDNVVAILQTVNHPNCRGLADYGNTPAGSTDIRIAGLSKLLPYISFVSAKGTGYNDQMEHTDYDFAALVRATEDSGYRGIYSIEMYPDGDSPPPADPIRAGNWMKDQLLANISA